MADDSKEEELSWRVIPLERRELSLADVLPTGQAFRWHRTREEPEEWSGVIKGRVYSLRQAENELKYHILNDTATDTEKENVSILRNYFQLDTISLSSLYSEWSEVDETMSEACLHCPGVRVLHQDPLETLLSFICSSNNNISRISLMMNRLSRHFGTSLGLYRGREFHSFPTVESLSAPNTETVLRELGFGYRAKYVCGAVSYLSSQTSDWLESLTDLSYSEAWEALQVIPGVGPKVSDCVCLIGLRKYEAVPVDVHMWRVSERLYGLQGTGKNLSLAVYKQIGDMFRKRYGPYAGLAQAVLFRREILRGRS